MTDRTYKVWHGGLLRCCLASLDMFMVATETDPVDGDTLNCKFHDDGGGMIFRDGAWQWNRPHDLGEL